MIAVLRTWRTFISYFQSNVNSTLVNAKDTSAVENNTVNKENDQKVDDTHNVEMHDLGSDNSDTEVEEILVRDETSWLTGEIEQNPTKVKKCENRETFGLYISVNISVMI